MNAHELGNKLKEMYATPGMNKVAMIHLFGIMFANDIENLGLKPIEIVKLADLPESYKAEVSKGLKLAHLVNVKEKYVEMFK